MALIQEKWLDAAVIEKLYDLYGSFTLANNQSSWANITGFTLDNSVGKFAQITYSLLRHHQTSLLTGFNSAVNVIIKNTDGDYIVGGAFTSYNGNAACPDYICKIKKDGTLDTSWGVSPGGIVYSIIQNSDGDYIVGCAGTKRLFKFKKLDGTNDTTFNNGSGFDNHVYSVCQDTNGDYVCMGAFTTYNAVTVPSYCCKISAAGTFDSSWNSGGTGLNTNGVQGDKVIALANGKYIIGGGFTQYNGATCNAYFARLNANGTNDTTFNSGNTGFSGALESFIEDSDGNYICVGNFGTYNGLGDVPNNICKINTDGTINTSFNYGTGTRGTNTLCHSIAQDSEGRYLLGGAFTSYNGDANCPDRFCRLNSDGSLDTTFNYGTGTRGFDANNIYGIVQANDGGYIVGGNNFDSYNGDTNCSNNFCKIKENGNLRLFYSNYDYLQESGSLYVIYSEELEKWVVSGENFAGNSAGVEFRVNSNQVQYKSSNLAGSVVTSSLKYYGKYL